MNIWIYRYLDPHRHFFHRVLSHYIPTPDLEQESSRMGKIPRCLHTTGWTTFTSITDTIRNLRKNHYCQRDLFLAQCGLATDVMDDVREKPQGGGA